GQAIGHDVVEGIVADAGIGVAGSSGDVAAKTEGRLALRALRRVREGTLIGWAVRLFVERRERTTGRSAAMVAYTHGVVVVPAIRVLRTHRGAGTPHIIWKRPAVGERGAERFPVVAPRVRGGGVVAGLSWFDRGLVQPAIREAGRYIVPALPPLDEHREVAAPELETPRRTPQEVSLIPSTFHEGMIQPEFIARHVYGARAEWLDVHIEVHTIHYADVGKSPIVVGGVIEVPLGKGFRAWCSLQ